MNRDSRLFGRVLRALTLLSVAALCLCRLADAAEKGMEEVVLIKQCAEQAELLKAKLSEASLWTDAKRKEELLGYLKLAGTLRPVALAPILVPHIAYDPNPDRAETRVRPPWFQYPAYGVLMSIGAPSVSYVLSEMKKTDPKGATEDVVKHRLLTSCLCDIYEPGGHGIALAKKRLEIELGKTNDKKENASLRAALNYSLFTVQGVLRLPSAAGHAWH